ESERIRTGFGRALRLMSLATLPLTAAALALGPRAIEVVYGSSYNGAGSALRLLSLGFPLVPLVSVSNALLLGIGRIRAPVVAGLAGRAALVLGLAAGLVVFGALARLLRSCRRTTRRGSGRRWALGSEACWWRSGGVRPRKAGDADPAAAASRRVHGRDR